MNTFYKILICDKSSSFLNLLKAMLNEDPVNTYEVLVSTNGRDACNLAFFDKPDLIIMSIDLPILSGYETIKKIKSTASQKRIPIIAMSSEYDFKETFEAGADDFIMKPFNSHELFLRIQLNLMLAQRSNEIVMEHEILIAQKQEAIYQRDTIFRQQTDLMDDLQYARFVQNAMMPGIEIFQNYFSSHFIFNRPKYIVSGDFYWLTKKNNLTLLAVGDCTGHGMSGALMTMAGVAFLNEIVNSEKQFDAGQILNDLRKKVTHLLNQKGTIGEASNGMDIAFCIYDERNSTLQYAGANNPLYLAKKGLPMEIIKGDRMPIGFFFSYEQPFNTHVIQIQKGDSVYLFTDGYPDQFGGPFEKKFRYNQFIELIDKASRIPEMEEQQQLITKTMDEWINGYEQLDDMLILGIRF